MKNEREPEKYVPPAVPHNETIEFIKWFCGKKHHKPITYIVHGQEFKA